MCLVLEEISGLAMIKLLDLRTVCTNTNKMKFIRNTGFLDITNNSSEPPIFGKQEALGIVDLVSIGYYKVNQSILQYHLNPFYEFKPL